MTPTSVVECPKVTLMLCDYAPPVLVSKTGLARFATSGSVVVSSGCYKRPEETLVTGQALLHPVGRY